MKTRVIGRMHMKEQNNHINVEFNHHIVLSKDKQQTADFLTGILDLPDAVPADGREPDFFLCIDFKNGVTLLITEVEEHNIGHYAFKVSPKDFNLIVRRLQERKIEYWADPRGQRPSECYEENGKRGVYFIEPSGHALEVLTIIE